MIASQVGGNSLGSNITIHSAKTPLPTVLEGRSIYAEPLSSLQTDALYSAIGDSTHSSLWNYMLNGPFSDRQAFERYIDEKAQSKDPLFWAIVDKKTHKAIGTLALMNIRPRDGVVEVGHVLFSPQLQRTTAATEIMFLMARHVFEELGYRRYEWKTNNLNENSKKAARRLGFQFEGVFKQHMVVKGRSRDTAWFSMLDKDWPVVKRGFEKWLEPQNFDETGEQRASLAVLRNCR